jgi:hypothetical protein
VLYFWNKNIDLSQFREISLKPLIDRVLGVSLFTREGVGGISSGSRCDKNATFI